MTLLADPGGLLGSQDPTYQWCPEFATSYGDEAAALYEDACSPMGWILDPWQRAALRMAFAVDPDGVLSCFEMAIILSRQDGKGEVLIAIELAWLFLFHEPLISHSAHLYPTAREHFMKMLFIIQTNPEYERRVSKIREGKGDEEIILKTGGRLKFFSRKGGAGLGFTGSKLVFDEAMILDALAVGVGLPTMATKPSAQVIYTGSAGDKESTQLAAVRQRGLDRDPAVGLMMWEARKPVYDERGDLVDGDDPEDPATWAKTNPALGRRISVAYVRKEAKPMGGFRAPEWWRQRLGIGDYPAREAAWKVINREVWDATCDPSSLLGPGRALLIDADAETGVYTLGVAGRRTADSRGHVEIIDRRRGSQWVVPKIEAMRVERKRRYPIVVLPTSIAAHLGFDLERIHYKVHRPTATQYAGACQALVQDLGAGLLVHIGQDSMTKAAGNGDKRKGVEGGWVWDRDQPGQSPIVCATLGWWAVKAGLITVRSRVF